MFFSNPKRAAKKTTESRKGRKSSAAEMRAAAIEVATSQARAEADLAAREQYRRIRERAMYERFAGTNPEFDAAVKRSLAEAGVLVALPEQWVVAAKGLGCKCRRCVGTGQFITGMVNGVPTGPGGICYRCEGKGFQTDADARRNIAYDRFAAARAAEAMMGGESGEDDDYGG